jgi:hypothetical protein
MKRFAYFYSGCGFEDNCGKDEICFDKNVTLGEFECRKMSISNFFLIKIFIKIIHYNIIFVI